MVSYWLAVQ